MTEGVTAQVSSPYTNVGRRLHIARLLLKMSQETLGKRAGVSKQYISRLENNRALRPSLDVLERLASALGYETVGDLLSGTVPTRKIDDAGGGAKERRRPTTNAVSVDAYRDATGARPLPVYRSASAGDPRDRENSPYPDHAEYPPVGKELLIGPHGFGVIVQGRSMTKRNVHDGDIVWVNPDRPPREGGIVVARCWDTDDGEEELGMAVKSLIGGGLHSADCEATTVNCGRFDVIGPVVCITSTRVPD